jgi:hypothetical protein
LGLPHVSFRIPKHSFTFVCATLGLAWLSSAQTTPTTTVLTAAPVSLNIGSVVTLTATGRLNGQPVAGGVVQFLDGARFLGAVQVIRAGVSAGTATLKTSSFAAGSHALVASYSGAPNGSQQAAASQSAQVVVQVLEPGNVSSTTTALGSRPDSTHPGTYVLTATVTNAGLFPPTGTVAFQDLTTGMGLGTASLQGAAVQQSFLPPTSYPIRGYEQSAVAVGDFNNDGYPDVVVTDDINNAVDVLLADPANPGQFLPYVQYSTGNSPFFIAVGDVNSDGIPDLVVANDQDRTVSVLLGDPAHPGQFLTQLTYAVGFLPTGIAINDFNRDGVPDLAVVNRGDGTIGILLGDPAHPGLFLAQSTYAVGQSPYFVATGDLNGDGYADLVVTNSLSNNISVLLGDPSHPGQFLTQTVYPVGMYPYAVALGDLNGDGKLDIAVTNTNEGTLGVLLADANHQGDFLAEVTYGLGSANGRNSALAIGDVNGDGIPDIVSSALDMDVLYGDPAHPGRFLAPIVYFGQGGLFAEADFNGDGLLDLATVPNPAITQGLINIHLNSLTTLQTGVLSSVAISGAGFHNLQADYQGSASTAGSSSSLVISIPSSTQTALTVNPPNALIGTVVQLTATVTVNAKPVVSGAVQFSEGNRVLGTASVLSNGNAILKTSSFTPGNHTIVATYSGAPYSAQAVGGSSSAGAPLVVAAPASSVTLLTEAANAVTPANVDLSAAVEGFDFAAPTGAVAFNNPTTGKLLGTVPLAPGPFAFVAAGSYPTGFGSGKTIAADFNNDGFEDLAIIQNTQITVLLADPSHAGQFESPVIYTTYQEGVYIAATDVNGDGLVDLIVANGFSNNISVLLGDLQHPGQFLAAVNYPTGSDAEFIALGDFNQDGLPDIAVINTGDKSIGLLFGDPSHPGQFLPQVILDGHTFAFSLVVGDFNRDGVPDIATADGSINVYFSDPSRPGQFLSPVTYTVAPQTIVIGAGDFNGDGLLDLAGVGDQGVMSVLLADPSHAGHFQGPVTTTLLGYSTNSVAVADFNGDGLSDLVMSGSPGPVLFLNDKQHPGQFLTTPISPPPNTGLVAVGAAVADFNGDGVPDLVIDGYAANAVFAYWGGTSATAALNDVVVNQTAPQVLNAAYAGDANYGANASNSVPAVIPQATTTTLLITPMNPPFGELVTFTATVTLGQTPVTAGTVTFESLAGPSVSNVTSQILGTVQVVSSGVGIGTATLRTRALPPSGVTQTVVAIYNGALGAASSRSFPNSLSVPSQLPPSIALAATPNATNPLNYDFSVVLQGAGITPPSGSVVLANLTNGWDHDPVPPVAPSSLTFFPALNYPVGNRPNVSITADLNGDGIPDIAVASSVASTVSILLSDPSNRGHFLPAVTYNLAAGFGPEAMAVGDFNGDGLLDIAVAGLHSTTILFNSASGAFAVGNTYPGGTFVATADVNNDGTPDLVTGPSSNALVGVLLGDPSHPGQFIAGTAAVTTAGAYVPTSLAVADFNGDGIPDLAIGFVTPGGPTSTPTVGYLSVLLGDPLRPGLFLPPLNRTDVGIPSSVLTADFNIDGSPDLLINGNAILLADKTMPGQFLALVSLGTASTSTVAVGDLNADGIPDIAELTPGSTVILLGNGGAPGTFLPPVSEPATGNSIALGDFNDDAKADIAITTPTPAAAGVTVLLSSSISTATLTNVFLPGKTDVQQSVLAQYFGDTIYVGGQSNTLMLNGSGTYPIQLTVSASTTTTPLGGTVSFLLNGGYDGAYSLYDGGTLLDSMTVAVGQHPIFTETFTTPGPHLISAAYAGTDLYSAGISNTITITVTGTLPAQALSATPNPVLVPVGVLVGATTINWNAPQAATVELHIGSPSGILFAEGGSTGSAQTGSWVTDGMRVYLQDTSGGKPLTDANTVAVLVLHVNQQLALTANPNPIPVSPGAVVGSTLLEWNDPTAQTVEIHVGSPDGILFAGGGSIGSAQTGLWVTNGMTFYLQDTSGGKTLTADNTVARVTAVLEQKTFLTGSPNPIPVTAGATLGATTISWIADTSSQVEVHVGAPNGTLFAAGGPVGSSPTGNWVSDGLTFYLQDVTGGKPLTAANTLSTLVVHLQQPAASLTATPNPIEVSTGVTVGTTNIAWDAPLAQTVEIHVGSPCGTLFAAGGSKGSAETGAWVSNGLMFYLQDTTGGKPLTSANTLATVNVIVQQQ